MTHITQLKQTLKLATIVTSLFISSNAQALKEVAITQIVDHPSLNAIRDGIIEGLEEKGFVAGKNIKIKFESAQGNPSIAAQISKKFAGLKPAVVVPISTPSAQSIVQNIKDIPVVFAAISDPIGARIVSSLEKPGGNVTGVADIPPLKEQIEFIETCVPKLKKLGVIYNPGESNMVSFVEGLKPILQKKNIKLVTAAASKSSDVKSAAHSIIDRVDAIFIGNDNTVISGVEALVKTALDANKPLFVSDPESVDRGALAAYAYDQKQMGKQVGEMVAKVLNGTNPGDIPVERAQGLKQSMNPKTAEKLKITCKLSN